MALTFDISEDEAAIAASVARFCERRLGATLQERQPIAFTRELWQALADLGVFYLSSAADGPLGGFMGLVAAFQELGRAGFPGPLVATVVAAAIPLDQPTGDALRRGELLCAFGRPPLMPWGIQADLFLGLADGQVRRLAVFKRTPVETLGGEQCAHVDYREETDLVAFSKIRPLFDVAQASLMVGAGLALVEGAADHAANRKQFGQPIGGFQGLAFQLVDAVTALEAAQLLLRAAALRLDEGSPQGPHLGVAARLSAGRAARAACYATHQTFGAMGAAREGPVYWLSRRVAQWSAQAPSERADWDAFALDLPPSFLDAQSEALR